jgi:NADPH-dependent F420 reductase
MNISVIGATGTMGMVISRALAKASHHIYLCGHSVEKTQATLSALRKEIPQGNFTVPASTIEAVEQSDIVILALWYHQQEAFVKEIGTAADGKIVVSNANPFGRTGGSAIPENTSVAEMLATLLPKSVIVKAFSTAFAADYANPSFAGSKADMFVASDDEHALTVVCGLVADGGFNPINAGKLASARVLEQMMILLGGIGMREHYNWLAGWKILHS